MTDPQTPVPTRAKIALALAALWVSLGALFKLFAGTPADLPATIQNFPLLTPTWSFRLAIGVELTIIILALLRPRVGVRLLVLLFVVFDLLLISMIRGGDPSCGCFGSKVPIQPWQMMTIDTVLLLGLLLSGAWSAFPARTLAPLRLLPLVAIVVIYPWFKFKEAAITTTKDETTGETTVEVQGDWHNFDITAWDGMLIHDTDLAAFFEDPESVDLIPPPAHVIIYRLSCEHCKEHFQNLSLQPITDRPIVLVRIPDNEGSVEADVISGVKPEALFDFDLRTLPRGYGITTPVTFEIDEVFTVGQVTEHVGDDHDH